jgi:urease accessory protein
MHRLASATGLGALALLAAQPALSHVGGHAHAHGAGGLLAGLAHPLLGLDHLLAMLAVGVWSARLAGPGSSRLSLLALPAAFVATVALGALGAFGGLALPGVELFIAGSVVVLGLLIAAAVVLPVWAGAALVALFGLFHGYAHGAEMPAAAQPLLYGLGFLSATAALHLAGLGLGLLARDGLRATALRIAAGLAALTGLVILAA